MLAALALSQAVAAADHEAPTPALVPSAERVSTVDGIDRLKAWMAAKKTNSSRVNLRAEESQAVRPPRSLAQVMKAIAESHRSTHEARRIATERADARLADERSWQAAYDRPWHAAKEEAVRKLTRKASATAAGLAKRVALPSEVAHSQDQMERAEASEYDGTLADEAASPVDAELRLLRAAELVHGEGEKEDDSEGAAVSFLQFQFETGDDETSLKAESSGGAMKKLKKKYKAQTKIAEAHERIDDMKEAKKKLKKKQKADEKKEAAEERKVAAHDRKREAEQQQEEEEGEGEAVAASEQSAGAEQSAVSDASSDRVAARKAEHEKMLQQRQAGRDLMREQREARLKQKKAEHEADKLRSQHLKVDNQDGAEEEQEEQEQQEQQRQVVREVKDLLKQLRQLGKWTVKVKATSTRDDDEGETSRQNWEPEIQPRDSRAGLNDSHGTLISKGW